ncbi:MAG: PRC-barrel domain-containing protein, partial [Nodosilinea sp.]
MPLYRLEDYYPDYRETLADGQIDKIGSYSVYARGDDKVGSVKDLLVDDSGRFRYLVVDTGLWIFGKTVLLPIGVAEFDYNESRIYVNALTKEQVEHLPEYDDNLVVDEDYENQIRRVYQPIAQGRSSRQFLGNNYPSGQNEAPAGDLRRMPALGNTATQNASTQGDLRRMGPIGGTPAAGAAQTPIAQPGSSVYDQEAGYYGLSEEDNHQLLQDYEERLITRRSRS